MELNAETAYQPIGRPKRLPDEIARMLAGEIQDGRLRAGDRLPTEHRLAASFAVSRNVVREAIAQLKYDGLVEARQGTGAFVAEPSHRRTFRISPECFEKRKELRQILELFAGVQATAAGLAARGRTRVQLATMRDALKRMAQPATDEPALETRLDAEIDFYHVIAGASGNTYVMEFVEWLSRRVTTHLRSVACKNARAAETGADVLREHENVFAAIRAKDAEAAGDMARRHFVQAAERLSRRADLADQ